MMGCRTIMQTRMTPVLLLATLLTSFNGSLFVTDALKHTSSLRNTWYREEHASTSLKYPIQDSDRSLESSCNVPFADNFDDYMGKSNLQCGELVRTGVTYGFSKICTSCVTCRIRKRSTDFTNHTGGYLLEGLMGGVLSLGFDAPVNSFSFGVDFTTSNANISLSFYNGTGGEESVFLEQDYMFVGEGGRYEYSGTDCITKVSIVFHGDANHSFVFDNVQYCRCDGVEPVLLDAMIDSTGMNQQEESYEKASLKKKKKSSKHHRDLMPSSLE